MRKKFLIIIGVLILVGFVFGFGYWLIYERIPQKELGETPTLEEPQEEPKTKLVQKITISGEVKEIRDNSLVLFVENELLEVLINEETEFITPMESQKEEVAIGENEAVEPKSVKAKKVAFEDIKVGDEVSISAKEENRELMAVSILILK